MNDQPVTEPQKFIGNIFWVAASNLAVPLVGLISMPALTKNYTAYTYAVWMQSVFIVWLLSFILNLSFGNAIVRFLAGEDDKEVRRRSLGAMLWPVLTFDCLILIISLLLRQDISIIMFGTPYYASIVPLIMLWAATEAVFSLLIAYWLARRKIRRLSIIQICLATLKMAALVILASAASDLACIIGCIAAIESVVTIVVFGMIIREIGWPTPAMVGLKSYMAFSIPLIPSGILFWAISVSDRYFITYLLSLSQAGIYSASFAIGSLISLFFSPIQVALFPVLSRLWEQKEQSKVGSYLEYSNKLFLTLAIPSAAGLYILSQPLLGILTTPDYMVGAGLVLLVALATILLGLYQINVYVILLTQKTKWLTPIIFIAATANICINIALIPVVGIIGSAIAAIVAYLILAVTVMVWARIVIKYTISVRFIVKVIIGASLMALCISFIHIGGMLGIAILAIAGVIIFSLWMWLTRAFSTGDIMLLKDIIRGLKKGALLR